MDDNVLTKRFSFESQVSFRLELTTPACPIKDVVNDTIAIVWAISDVGWSGRLLFYKLIAYRRDNNNKWNIAYIFHDK